MDVLEIRECTNGMKAAYIQPNGDITLIPVCVWAIISDGTRRRATGMGGVEHMHDLEQPEGFICYIPGEFDEKEAHAFASNIYHHRRAHGELQQFDNFDRLHA